MNSGQSVRSTSLARSHKYVNNFAGVWLISVAFGGWNGLKPTSRRCQAFLDTLLRFNLLFLPMNEGNVESTMATATEQS